MGFLQPLALMGLAAASIPLLLHLWRQRLPPIVEFPAVRYLAETARQHSRTLKLHHLLLLVLRTLLIVAIVMAASRPVVDRWIPGVAGAHPPTAVAVVFDNSLSSQTIRNGAPSIDALRNLAQGLLDQLNPSDRLWLVLADGRPRRTTLGEAGEILDSLAPWPLRMDLGAAVSQAQRVLDTDPLPNAELHVLSDLQRSALSIASGPPVPILAVELAGTAPENRGIAAVRLSDPLWRADGGTVVVYAAGSGGASPGPVTVQLADGPARRTVLEAGEAAEVRLAAPPPGWWVGEAVFAPDELRADDRGFFAVRVAPPARVSVASGVGRFVRDAVSVLNVAGRVEAGTEITVATTPMSGHTLLLPPEDAAHMGALNRALSSQGIPWRFETAGSPGLVDSSEVPMIGGTEVMRRYRLAATGQARGVLATVDGEPWIVQSGDAVLVGSRLEDTWTDLPIRPGFVVALDYLLNRSLRGEVAPVMASPGARVGVPDRVTSVVGPGFARTVEPGGFMTAPATLGAFFLLAGSDTVGTLAVNVDARESTLDAATRREVRDAFGETTRLVSASDYAAVRLASVQQAELTGFFLVVAILLAIAEVILARWGSAGGSEPARFAS